MSRTFSKFVVFSNGLDLHPFIQLLAGGILLGGIYGLAAFGLSITFGVLNVLNLAHGEFLMPGSLLSYGLFVGLGINPFVAAILVIPPCIATNTGMSLWHFFFLAHNGRIFQYWTGKYTWLIVPIGGAVLLISALCGSYDWLYRKGVWRRKRDVND